MLHLLDVQETLTPADHQTHRRYSFEVPEDCAELELSVRYSPKRTFEAESRKLMAAVLRAQTESLTRRAGESLARQWAANLASQAAAVRISNLATVSLDDALGAYRGAGHRQANEQRLSIGRETASPGLVAGPLPAGTWMLTLSAHTLVSDQCEVSIQIGAVMA